MPKLEILFDDSTGEFVVHVIDALTHAEEHVLVDQLVEQLRSQGFSVKTENYREQPKLPEVEDQLQELLKEVL